MSQDPSCQDQLETAQAQIQQLSQQLMLEREIAQSTQLQLQAQIEQQQQRLSKLEIQESTYRHLFDCNPQPMWIYDLATLHFLAVNDAAVGQYGYSRDEFLAMTINDIRDMHAWVHNTVQTDHESNKLGIWQHHLRDGTVIQVETVSFVHEFNGRLAELVMAQDVTDRQQAQRELQMLNQELEQKVRDRTAALTASETRLNLLINKNPATIYSCEPHGDYACKFISKNAETLLGYTPEEFYAVPDFWKQQLHPDDKARVFSAIPSLFEGGILKHEYRLRHRDGHYIWVHDELTLLRDDAGNPTEIMGFTANVSDHKQSETQIKRQLAAMESAFDGIGITQNNVFIYVNRAQLQMFGYSAAEMLGQPWSILYSADEIARLEREVVPILIRDRSWTGEVIATRKDGTTFDQELSLSINEDDLTICISKDISDRKQAEISLLNYSQQVEDLYNNAPCGYCSLDADSHITGINNTALLWLDYTREEVIGQPITQFISVDSKKIYEGESQLLRQSGQLKRLNYEIVLRGSDGGRMTVLFCEEAQKDADHKVIGSRITITDIRQRIKVEKLKQQQLTGANLLRQISDRIRQTLDLPTIFSTACHEVRQALKADRVGIFQFYPEFNYNDGQFIAESIVGDYPSALNTNVHDHCFGDNFAHLYSQGRYYAVTDIEEGNLSTCHQDILRQFQVRSNLVVPLIKSENELWGLLCIHQCSQPRHWHIPEIELVQQIANQLAIAINQASLYQRIQDELRIRQQAEVQIKRQLEQQRTLAAITEIVRESLDETTILSTVTQHVKNLLQCDRVIIFRLYPDGCSQIVEESVSSEFVSLKHQQWKDEVWSDEILELYWQGKPRIVADVTQDQWTDCLIEYSQEGQIQSKVVAPILQDAQADDNHRWVAPRAKKLWGIIVAHACTEKRVWQDTEAELLQQIANSVAISIQQASFLEQLQQELGDRQLAEQELAERNQQLSINNVELERATRLKDEFLANMSHELRTPLNSILGLTESLQEEIFGIVNERQQKALQTIEKSGTHLLNLINDILDVAKIASGEMKLECSSVGVEQLCSSSLSFLRQQAHKKQIQIITKIPSQLPNLYIDEGRIRQVLLNLLTNAIKFTPVGGTVKLNASLMLAAPDTNQPNYLRFSIIDTGIGISPENLSRLFKPFIQIDSALNRKQMGTGLGLALVKQIVELHGGKVGLTSELGVGSCFTVDLPYSQEVVMPNLSPEISPSSSPLPDSSHSSSHLVLLAEDNLANVATISSYLEAKGYRLICANNGQEAIDLTILHQPNLIVMDIQMPDLDGLEAIRQIRQRENFREIPIIALTALTMQGDRERCLEAGANEYLSKPVRLKNLHNLITSLLGCV